MNCGFLSSFIISKRVSTLFFDQPKTGFRFHSANALALGVISPLHLQSPRLTRYFLGINLGSEQLPGILGYVGGLFATAILFIVNHNMFSFIRTLTPLGYGLHLFAMAPMLIVPFTAKFVAFTAFVAKDTAAHRYVAIHGKNAGGSHLNNGRPYLQPAKACVKLAVLKRGSFWNRKKERRERG